MKTKVLNQSFNILLFLILVYTGSLITLLFSQFNPSPNTVLIIPKTGTGEITIQTPENKTYTGPMSGYYPATHGFENESIGDSPQGWTKFSEVKRTTSIVESYNGHKNVFKIYVNYSSVITNNIFSPKTYGTMECWLLTTDVSKGTEIILPDGSDWVVRFGIINGFFIYTSASNIISGAPIPQNNQWYHIRIDFRCNGAPSYQNLNETRFFVYIDGLLYGEFPFTSVVSQIDRSVIGLGYTSLLTSYLDAVGYSWDPNYNIGDNMNEGLLLSYDTNDDFNWIGYSLDGQTNQTIPGNTTIPMLSDGHHSIQVFGNDSLGAIYESNKRYFTVITSIPEITINSPSNNEIFGSSAPTYNLSIINPYEAIWYTLDGGGMNITANGLTGTINQTEWDKFLDDFVIITFYANNSGGIIGNAIVQVIKQVSEGNGSSQISGYNVIALIGVSSVLTLLILKKRINN